MGMGIDPITLATLQRIMGANNQLGGGQALQGLAQGGQQAGGGFFGAGGMGIPLLGAAGGLMEGIGGAIMHSQNRKDRKRSEQRANDLAGWQTAVQQGQANSNGFRELMQLLLGSSQRGGF